MTNIFVVTIEFNISIQSYKPGWVRQWEAFISCRIDGRFDSFCCLLYINCHDEKCYYQVDSINLTNGFVMKELSIFFIDA